MTVFAVHHSTTYRYSRPVGFGAHRFMFRPQDASDQRLLDFELVITPRPVALRWSRDVFGNAIGSARFGVEGDTLEFDCRMRVEHGAAAPDAAAIEPGARSLPATVDLAESPFLAPYMQGSDAGADAMVAGWAHGFLRSDGPTATLDLLAAMTRAIRRDFAYERRVERGVQAPAETLELRSGTCRDFALLMVAATRALGLAARFVSGYLYVPSRDRDNLRGGGATHAWTQVYVSGLGWVDFDPTNATVGNAGLIRIAVTRDPQQALPLTGSFSGFRSDALGMDVAVQVRREDAVGGQPARWSHVA